MTKLEQHSRKGDSIFHFGRLRFWLSASETKTCHGQTDTQLHTQPGVGIGWIPPPKKYYMQLIIYFKVQTEIFKPYNLLHLYS